MDLSVIREYQAKGWNLIPVNGKQPITKDWTNNTNSWEHEDFVGLNVGLVTGSRSNLVVVDIDNRGDTNADDKFDAIIKQFPTDLVSRTGGKGYHLFYRHPNNGKKIPNRVGKDGIDIRGDGGMVVIPPSETPKGKYEWLKTGPPGEFPLNLISKPALEKSKGEYESWVYSALQGVGRGLRNDTCTRLAGYFAHKGLPMLTAFSILKDWNEKNSSPLPTYEIKTVLESIYHREKDKKKEKKADPTKFKLVNFKNYMARFGGEKVQWTIDDWLPASTIGFVVSPPGSYKTWLLMDLAISVASGKPFLGKFPVKNRGPVILIQQEDDHSQTVERLATIARTRFELFETSFEDDLFEVRTPPDLPIYIHPDRNFRFDNEETTKLFAEQVKEIKPALVIIDPLYSATPIEDYMSKAAEQMFFIKTLRDEYKTSFMIAHHRKKGGDLAREGLWGSQFLNAFLETGWQIKPEGESNIEIKRHFKAASNHEVINIGFDIDTIATKYNVFMEDKKEVAEETLEQKMIKALKDGPLTTAELSKELGVHKSTVSRNKKEWKKLNLIVEVDGKLKLDTDIDFDF